MEIKLYLRMILRSWWVVVLTGLTAALVALVTAYLATPIFSSSARYLVSPNPNYLGGDVDYNLIYSLDTLDKRSIITTYAEVLNSPRIYTDTIQSLGLKESDLVDYTHAAVVFPETNVVDLTVTGPDPKLVVQLNNQIGQLAVAFVENLYPIYDMGLLDPAANPTTPIYPQPLRDTGVALVVGLALGIGLALMRELMRVPIGNFLQHRKLDDISQALKRTVFQETLRDLTIKQSDQFSLCFVRLDGLRDYLEVLPLPTLQNCLRYVTQVLKNQLRGNDLVGRWDDLDYSIVLSNTSGKAALNTMKRVKTVLSTPIKIDISNEELDLKPLIGITEYHAGDDLSTLTGDAGHALDFAGKSGGIYLNDATG